MQPGIVTNQEELTQILHLSQQNLRTNITDVERQKEGFISWNYSLELLRKMHTLHPSIIVKDGNKVIGYAMVALKEARHFHPDLDAMVEHLETLRYDGKELSGYHYYVMGQICIHKDYRGKGVFDMLYKKHKDLFEKDYDFVVTEISSSNKRSMRAHQKIGFTIFHTYKDAVDEWNVVIWDWQ